MGCKFTFDGCGINIDGRRILTASRSDWDTDVLRDFCALAVVAPDLLAFAQRWADIVQGGDPVEALEGWAQEMVEEARAAIARAEGGA